MAAVMYGEFWGGLNAYSILVNKMPRLNSIRRVVNRQSFRVNKELLDTLIGAATGGTASASHKEVSFNQFTAAGGIDNQGAPVINTVTDINRASTSDDVTALKEFLVNVNVRPSYPRDLSGNGGGALA